MITVVTGPPCSGKTTHVRTHAQPGDIVIDFDAIARALGAQHSHTQNGAIRHVALMARRAALDAAFAVADQTNVWVVDCTISPARMRQYQAAGARIVTLQADRAELHRRAARERPRLWHRLIDEWQAPQVPGSRTW